MANKSPNAIFIVIIFLLILAFSLLIPAIFVAQESPQTISYNQELNDIKTFSGSIDSTITNINQSASPSNINITVHNRQSGMINTISLLNESDSEILEFSSGNITVSLSNVVNSNTVIIQYTYPLYITWPNGSEQIIQNINIIVLILFVFIIGSVAYIRGEI